MRIIFSLNNTNLFYEPEAVGGLSYKVNRKYKSMCLRSYYKTIQIQTYLKDRTNFLIQTTYSAIYIIDKCKLHPNMFTP